MPDINVMYSVTCQNVTYDVSPWWSARMAARTGKRQEDSNSRVAYIGLVRQRQNGLGSTERLGEGK